jgi:phage tail sheath protein FI
MSVVKLTTPGVYVQEISALPPSVAEVETAIPAFIGYVEKADLYKDGDSKRLLVPTKINGLSEYEHYFGRSPVEKDESIYISIQEPTATNPAYQVKVTVDPTLTSEYNMYYALRHFYDNGGGTCYVVAADTFTSGGGTVSKDKLKAALDTVKDVDEVTLLVVPEAAKAGDAGYKEIVGAMIAQASTFKDRFALIDPFVVTPKDSSNPGGKIDTDVEYIRNASLGVMENRYAAAYYPNLVTTYNYNFGYDAAKGYIIDGLKIDSYTDSTGADVANLTVGQTGAGAKVPVGSVVYNLVVSEFQKQFITLPPSPAMAGIYTRVDANRGVWKAPANEAVASVIGPSIPMSDRDQSSLNIDANSGKSINVIRTFPGYGSIVWGARTMNGNDNEWRYISVRRFFNMVEESVKKSSQWAVFEPNTAGTWVKIQAMIENYLFLKWRDGALAGAKPEQAYYVRVGLGSTMTSVDVLEGKLNIEIGMAVARPAEFIVLKFTQLMQQS